MGVYCIFFNKLLLQEEGLTGVKICEDCNAYAWLYFFSEIAIWSACMVIPAYLFYFFNQHKSQFYFFRQFKLLPLFFLVTGITFLADALLLYFPVFHINTFVLAICAIISWFVVWEVYRLSPKALQIKATHEFENILSKTTRNLQQEKEQLLHQNEQLKHFTHITSHNIRSPASNLTILIELYETEHEPAKKADLFQKIKASSYNLMHTINDLNQIIKANQLSDIQKDYLNFKSILEKVKTDLSSRIDHYNVKIIDDFNEAPGIDYPFVYLESIFLNLITNAIKYHMPERTPEIRINTYQNEKYVVLIFQDNGQGLDMEKYGKDIFKPWKTFHNNPDAKGIGLYITKMQIESMGGSISMESEVNQGATFTIQLKKP